jgi:hypothetical protein
MQQKELGMDVADVAASDVNLAKWLLAFDTNPPNVIAGDRLSEHRRTCELSVREYDYVLSAIYDLLIVGSDRNSNTYLTPLAQIIDWKTHQRPLSFAKLQANWQTRLYLYILARTTDLAPEQLSMTYWFANTATAVTINYDRSQYRQTEQDLYATLHQISQAQLEERFDQLPLGSAECTRCDFAHRCHRASEMDNAAIWDELAIDAYPEIAIYTEEDTDN